MLSFGSSLNKAGNGAIVMSNSGSYPLTSTTEAMFDLKRMKAFNFGLESDIVAELHDPNSMNISTFMEYVGGSVPQAPWTQIRFNPSNAKDMKTLITWIQSNGEEKHDNEIKQNIENSAKNYTADKDVGKYTDNDNIHGNKGEGFTPGKLQNYSSIVKNLNVNQPASEEKPFFEDPFKLPSGLIDSMNRYTHVYKTPINSILNMGSEAATSNPTSESTGQTAAAAPQVGAGKNAGPITDNTRKGTRRRRRSSNKPTTKSSTADAKDKDQKATATAGKTSDSKSKAITIKEGQTNIYVNYSQTPVVSSIFNPIYMIQVMGMTENVPLLSNIYDISKDITIYYDKSVQKGNWKNDAQGRFTEVGKDTAEKHATKMKINPLNNIVDSNISNCTMRELVKKSHKHNSILGQARYKYADFMFCKDLGKVSNNHLITLRKFAHPVGDNIFRLTSPKFRTTRPGDAPDFDSEGDVGRLVTWFGTDDNKLEDLTKFTVGASWKELESSIQSLGESADSANRSVNEINSAAGGMGGLQTSNVDVTAGIEVIRPNVPKMSFFEQQLIYAPSGSRLMTQSTMNMKDMIDASSGTYGSLAYGSDKNKIYTPKNTIQATHVYEGKLTYEQEFTLNFCYKLRAYDNINPKSAFLDLLGNILEVTYRRGKFWGGSRSATGPKEPAGGGNAPHGSPGGGRRGGSRSHGGGAGPAKNENIADDNWDMLEGLCRGLASGEIDWQSIMAKVSDLVNKISDTAKEMAQQIKDGWNANGFLGALGAGILAFRDALALLDDGLGGGGDGTGAGGPGGHPGGGPGGGPGRGAGSHMAKNAGKPAVYAMDSLLKGDNVGLWHLTVGNPKNPIFVCGNLILTKATVNFSGPLGIDDFPTELKVTCSLKHGRARDIIEISKMFTKGTNTLYYTVDRNKLADFFSVASTELEDEQNKEKILESLITEYETNLKALEQASKKETIDMLRKQAKEEFEKEQSAKKEREGDKYKEVEWKDSYFTMNEDTKITGPDNGTYHTRTEANLRHELGLLAERNNAIKKQLDEGLAKSGAIVTLGQDGHYQYTKPSSMYNTKLYDQTIYNDDEFTDETDGEYINSAKALRYETLGQDRDYIGRMVIDEVS